MGRKAHKSSRAGLRYKGSPEYPVTDGGEYYFKETQDQVGANERWWALTTLCLRLFALRGCGGVSLRWASTSGHCSSGWILLLCKYNEASTATSAWSTKRELYSSCELMPRVRGRRAPTLAHKTRPPSQHVLHSTHPTCLLSSSPPPLLRAPRSISPSGFCLRSSRVQAHHNP